VTYRSLSLPLRQLSIHRSNQATFSGNEARNNTAATIQAITSHESKKMAAIGGQSGSKVLEGSRSGLPVWVAVAEAMLDVGRGAGMVDSAMVGVWLVVVWIVGTLVLVRIVVLMVVVVVVRVVRVMRFTDLLLSCGGREGVNEIVLTAVGCIREAGSSSEVATGGGGILRAV